MKKKILWALGVMAGIIALQVVGLALVTHEVHGQPVMPEKAAAWEYVGQSQCKVCHNSAKEGGQWDTWKATGHARAFEILKSEAAQKVAAERGLDKPAHEAPECLRCHVTGYDVAAAAAPAKIKPEEGVQCESCHGPSSEHLKDARVIKFSPEKIAEIDIMANKVHPDASLCAGCHNPDSPTWDTARYTLADGTTAGFDFEQAWKKIAHEFPEGVMEEKYSGAYPVD
jgi:hypothetical protein